MKFLSTSGRRELLMASCAGLALSSSPGIAQDNPPPATQEPAASGSPEAGPQTAADASAAEQPAADIVVTGSRIASANLESISPVQTVTAQAIQQTGAVNLQDVLQQNPTFSTPTLSRTNSNFATFGGGIASADLRNLGTNRTLVLVNSRRFVSGLANSQLVDLNSIPTQFIERVDILTGGESSLYGSDAVAGVVNIIYKDHFEGLELGAQAGLSQRGDDTSKQVNLTIGGNFGGDNGDRGNVIAYIGYSKEGGVYSRDRARSAVDQTSLAAITGQVEDLFTLVVPNYSSFAPQGRFFSAPGVTAGTFDASNNFVTGFSANGTATRAPDGFNRSAFRTIAIPVERYLVATSGHYDVVPGVRVFLEGTFAKSHTHTVIEPFPLNSSGAGGVFQASGGFFNVEQRLPNGTIFANPFVPAALLRLLKDNTGDGLRDISFTQRLTSIANRTGTADRTTFRLVGGVEGEFAKGWHYDAYYGYGRTDDNQISTGQVNLASFRSALEVVPGPDGSLVCMDVQARAQGCVPANIFGLNRLSPAAANYVRADGSFQAVAEQTDAGVNVSGDLFDLWGAGPVALAAGGEYRKEASAQIFDALTQAGLNGGNATPNTSGSFNVKEAYGELQIPLLSDKPFFHRLQARGAVRVSDYSTVGTVYSWNYGGEWAPVADIRFRAVRARSTRAPNINELFLAPSQTFPTSLIDPCVGVTSATATALGTNCRAGTGVNSNIASNGGSFQQTQTDQQGVSGFNSGNPNLRAERGNSLTAGVVIAPRSIHALRNFTVTADYFDIKIDGAIVATPRQFILDRCYNGGDQAYCKFITRRATPEGSYSAGSLEFVNSGVTNSGGYRTSGLDFTAGYRQDLDEWGLAGRLSLNLAWTHLLRGYIVPLVGSPRDPFAGEVSQTVGTAPRDRGSINLLFEHGAASLNFHGTFIGPAYLDDQFVGQLTDAQGKAIDPHDSRVRIGSLFYSDIQARVRAGKNFEFYVGVVDAFDVQPPPLYSGLPGDVTGTETDAGTYDAIGRRFYAGATLRF